MIITAALVLSVIVFALALCVTAICQGDTDD